MTDWRRRASRLQEQLGSEHQDKLRMERGQTLVQTFSEDGLCLYLDCFGSLRELAGLAPGMGFDAITDDQWNKIARQLPDEQYAIMCLVEDYANGKKLSQDQQQLLDALCQ